MTKERQVVKLTVISGNQSSLKKKKKEYFRVRMAMHLFKMDAFEVDASRIKNLYYTKKNANCLVL